MKKTDLGFINILFVFVLFGILIPNTFAQAAETYIIVQFTSISNPGQDNASFLPDTVVTFSNDSSSSVIILTEEIFAGDEIVSGLVFLTPGNFYTITIQPKTIVKIEEPTIKDEQGYDCRIYANSSTAEIFCWLNGGEYVEPYEQEPFRRCETCGGENCCEYDCLCSKWIDEEILDPSAFDGRRDGGCFLNYFSIYPECYPWWDWQDRIACRYEGGCSSPYYRLKSVNCKKMASNLSFEFTYID